MKKMKKSICLILAMVMLLCSAAVPTSAFAAEAPTFKYVAFGDSIAAGFGVGGAESPYVDPALILSEDLIANPVKTAYPAVFGELLSQLGASRGVKTETVNLSTTAYRAQDVTETILKSGTKGEVCEWILETFLSEGASEVLLNYHDIFAKYLPDADFISVQLGGNDVIMGMLHQDEKDNPVVQPVLIGACLTLFGMDLKTALGGSLLVLKSNLENIKPKDFISAAKFFTRIIKNIDKYVDNSAQQVEEMVTALRSVNSEADLALLGMYNPYGNSLEYEGEVRDLGAVITGIFAGAAEIFMGSLVGKVDMEAAEAAAIEAAAGFKMEDLDLQKVYSEISSALKGLTNSITAALTKGTSTTQVLEKAKALLNVIVSQVSYPLQYMLLGKTATSPMKSLNEKVSAIAKRAGATYVDVYNISNEQNIDPHPDVEGHKEIAKLLFSAVAEKLAGAMNQLKVTLNKENASLIVGKTVQLKTSSKVAWKSSNTKVATVSSNGLVTAKGVGSATISAVTKNGASASCKVKVSASYVYECEKNGVYRYTAKTADAKQLKSEGWSCKKVFRAPAAGKKVYWILDKTTNRYRYTTNLTYAKQMKKAGNTAGFAFYSTTKTKTPVYEYAGGKNKDTYCYAATSAARKELKANGWTETGIAWYAEPKKA